MAEKMLTPLQEAKKQRLPYIRLVIDERHLKNGRGSIELSGPFSVKTAEEARDFFTRMLESQ